MVGGPRYRPAHRGRAGVAAALAQDQGGSLAKYPFLSDEWVSAARQLRAEYADRASPVGLTVRMNQIVRNVPFGDGTINAHLDTSSGLLDIDLGHLDTPDVTITVDYDLARSLLVDHDPTSAMQAFMSGRIKVDGDIGKLLGTQGTGIFGTSGDPAAAEMAQRLLDITE
jgi:hypothetical protein